MWDQPSAQQLGARNWRGGTPTYAQPIFMSEKEEWEEEGGTATEQTITEQTISRHKGTSTTAVLNAPTDKVIVANGPRAVLRSDYTTNPAMQPTVLSMEVDDDDACESEYRLRIGNQVKYLVISPGTFDRDTLSFPVPSLPRFPNNEEWTVASISRDETSDDLKVSLSNRTLAGVKSQWHHAKIDCLELEKTKQLTAMAFEAHSQSLTKATPPSPAIVIAKIARFEWELPRIEQETRAYRLLEGSGLAPRFLAHLHEKGRIMGFLLEKIEGRPASFEDLSICEGALRKLHELGFVHGDVNRYNFLITEDGAKLLDFEHLRENASPELMRRELETLRAELVDESGRGGGFMFHGDVS